MQDEHRIGTKIILGEIRQKLKQKLPARRYQCMGGDVSRISEKI